MIERFQKYTATVKMRRDPRFGSIRDRLDAYDGMRFETRALWKIDCAEDEFANKAYDGEFAMETPKGWPILWIASGDLTNIVQCS